MGSKRKKYLGGARVLEAKRKGNLGADEILVKLRREGEKAQWQLFKFDDYKARVEFREE